MAPTLSHALTILYPNLCNIKLAVFLFFTVFCDEKSISFWVKVHNSLQMCVAYEYHRKYFAHDTTNQKKKMDTIITAVFLLLAGIIHHSYIHSVCFLYGTSSFYSGKCPYTSTLTKVTSKPILHLCPQLTYSLETTIPSASFCPSLPIKSFPYSYYRETVYKTLKFDSDNSLAYTVSRTMLWDSSLCK